MCGIAGFFNVHQNYKKVPLKWENILSNMRESLDRRGPDDHGEFLSKTAALAHARLSIIDLTTGRQPIVKTIDGNTYAIVYNGELYNTEEIKNDLTLRGWEFETKTDTEAILCGFIEYGPDFVEKLNGIFAFAIWSEKDNKLYLYRDRFGIKPLFYTIFGETVIFGSEIKALFRYPGVKAQLDKTGLNEIFAMGPAKTPGLGVFKNIYEVLPANYIIFSNEAPKEIQYWVLESKPHTDSYEETVEKTSFLVTDSIKRQMVSDIPICTFLSGGIDSSIVSSVCASELRKKGIQLNTFSFDFVDNNKYFKSNAFQPEMDRPWVDKMVSYLKTNHIYLECDNIELADYLYKAVDAKDLPGMADVDSSLLYFCSKVKEYNTVTLTGECADEIFGGYPWFHKRESFEANTFPWTRNIDIRKALLSDDIVNELDIDEYIQRRYDESVKETPLLEGENATENRRREIAYLNLRWFMATLLNRMDRTSMYSGLEARVPYADHRIVEYIWNVPWDMKCRDGVVKGLLRDSAKGLLPDDVLYRKKSPYPKTYNPNYEKLLGERLMTVLNNLSSPINYLVDKDKVARFINTPSDYGKPWYGQLMAGPQMIAYMLQVNYWLEKYNIHIINS